MDAKKMFSKYYKRLSRESFIKALMCGLVVGFTVNLITAAICWFAEIKLLWLPIVLWVAVTAIATPLFYFLKLRPTAQLVAKRIDEFGLEERVLTMTELEGDDSFIARKQREDALNALNTVSAKLIKTVVSAGLIITVSVVGLCGLGMTTVSSLYALGKIGSGKDLVKDVVTGDPINYTIKYDVDGKGTLYGKGEQVLPDGQGASSVLVDAEHNWVFVDWELSSKRDPFIESEIEGPYRADGKVNKDVNVTAKLEELELNIAQEDGDGNNSGDGDGNGGEGGGGDDSNSKPGDGSSNGDGEGGQQGPQNPSDGNGDGAGGGAYDPKNQIIDGETYYGGSTFDNYYNEAMGELAQDGDMSDTLKNIIENYYDTIEE